MRTLNLNLHTAALCLLCIVFSQSPAAATVISSFDTDADGWTHAAGGDAGTTVSWVATGGNPGGRLVLDDASQSHTDYFDAPAKFLGDDITGYGTQLTFNIEDNQAAPATANAIGIFGNGLILTHSIGPLAANTWDSVSLTLDETGGWTIFNGPAPTAAQFQSVLGNVTQLAILGDYLNAPEIVSLDNVTMHVPEPSSLVPSIFAIGIGLLAYLMRRRR